MTGAAAPEVTWLDADTVQVRQPKGSHWEAPFLFLLFGRERALLIDTGATTDESVFPLRATVEDLIATWLRRNPVVFVRPYPLVVAHSHAHRDHIAGVIGEIMARTLGITRYSESSRFVQDLHVR